MENGPRSVTQMRWEASIGVSKNNIFNMNKIYSLC